MSDKKDLTRIEDLSEFLHQDDPDVDKLFSSDASSDDLPTLDDLEDDLESDFSTLPSDFGMPESQEEEPTTSVDILEESSEEPGEEENLFGETKGLGDFGEAEDFQNEVQWGQEEDNGFEQPSSEIEDDPFELSEEEGEEEGPENSQENSQENSEEESEEESQDNFQDDFQDESLDDSLEEVQTEYQTEPQAEQLQEIEEAQPFVPTPVSVSAPAPSFEPPKPRAAPETFKDLQEFAKNMSYGKMVASGNPPYSLILKNIKFQEDAQDILIILREHGLVDDTNEEAYQQSLNNGALLISQLSEYSAIYLAHRIRRFDLELLVGLSEELHPSKSYESGQKGLMRKENLRQNKVESIDLTMTPKTAQQVLISTTSTLESHHIQRYLGILTEHTLVRVDELELMHQMGNPADHKDDNGLSQEIESIQRELEENNDQSPQARAFGIKEIYQQLSEQLKAQAIKVGANALVGVNFHLTPMVENTKSGLINSYKITCTANAVWVTKSGD